MDLLDGRSEGIGALEEAVQRGRQALEDAVKAQLGPKKFGTFQLWALRTAGPDELRTGSETASVMLPIIMRGPLSGHSDFVKEVLVWGERWDAARRTGDGFGGAVTNVSSSHFERLNTFREGLNSLIERYNALLPPEAARVGVVGAEARATWEQATDTAQTARPAGPLVAAAIGAVVVTAALGIALSRRR